MKRTLTLLLAAVAGSLHADVKLPALFTDHLVLQRGKPVPVWGTADAGEEVTVTFGDQTKKAKADDKGSWKVTLDSLKASSEGAELAVKGNNEIVLKDVLVGEVWIGSGQSNMGWTVKASLNPEEEIAAASHPRIRLFTVPRQPADEPQKDLPEGTAWKVCSPETVPDFSAVAYFFGRELHEKLDVPIGLINTSWGGTRAEAWTSKPALEAVPTCKAIITGWEEFLKTYDVDKAREQYETSKKAQLERIEAIKKANAAPGATPTPVPAPPRPFENQLTTQHRPAVLYNAMVEPLVPFAVKGVIWYQGESNQQRAEQYLTLMPTLMKDWRAQWKDEFSFYIVQLAGFGNNKTWPQPVGADDTWAELQWAQLQAALKTPKSGLAVTNDIGEEKDIHPRNKQDVGRRLARQALGKDYIVKDIVLGGPLYAGNTTTGNKVTISFSNAKGMKARDGGELQGFIICGDDKVWKPAKAKIVAGRPQIQVWHESIASPVAVRYAWAAWCPEANLVNGEGLPASLFRTDKWDLSTKGAESPFGRPAPPAPAKKEETPEKPAALPKAA